MIPGGARSQGLRVPRPLSALVVLAACHRAEPELQVPLEVAHETVTFESTMALGPHRVEASSTTRRQRGTDARAEESDEQVELVWEDWDHFAYQRVRDGDPTVDVTVVDGVAWALGPQGGPTRQPDAEPYRNQLRLNWDPWAGSLAIFRGRVDLVEGENGIIEGRPARKFTLKLDPPEKGAPRNALELQTLDGFLWLDRATAVGLMGEARGTWLSGMEKNVANQVDLRLVVTRIGELQGIAAPGAH